MDLIMKVIHKSVATMNGQDLAIAVALGIILAQVVAKISKTAMYVIAKKMFDTK